MISTRVMPVLLLRGRGLVKTIRFKDPSYVGDPRNAVKIFNEKEVDELVLLDILATPEQAAPQFDLVYEIVTEAFMPVAYGGGIRTLDDARRMLATGVEKIVLNSYAAENPAFITEAAGALGSQSVVVCIDVKRSLFGRYGVFTRSGRQDARRDPVEFAKEMEARGAGELVVNSIDRDGTMQGYDLELLRAVTEAVKVPVIACGGAGSLQHLADAVSKGGASAVAAGSMFVYHGRHRAVLINFPSQEQLRETLGAR